MSARVSDLYVYYRVDPARTDDARRAAQRVLDAVAEATGVSGSLHRRADDPLTWMEVYRAVPDADRFLPALAHAAHAADIDAHLDGARHVEHFVPCA
ncbi:DUF4936 family protein [Denitromonas iodatirespirans]|uniref:DUF4936 family protein n=1 Tax=Denitromonas iodatirespirans TaxID=2795389 RepID=A0A944DIC7_DENI1|nr:DUF4936 family protein [Denitromonas iodatirespirans]MBT0963423.1 DUF4936 family protein [Denitromonas iodatirespirans]